VWVFSTRGRCCGTRHDRYVQTWHRGSKEGVKFRKGTRGGSQWPLCVLHIHRRIHVYMHMRRTRAYQRPAGKEKKRRRDTQLSKATTTLVQRARERTMRSSGRPNGNPNKKRESSRGGGLIRTHTCICPVSYMHMCETGVP